ncbi:MAG: hypothetical protein K2M34_04240 [Alphaproteobacteria bacterium]|nr:hypothetical protein [Alphaproteobacteria bacterium]
MAKKNNLRVFGLQLILVMPVAIFGMLAAKCMGDNATEQYIVSDKGANKIEYYSIQNSNDMHVMTFDGDTIFKNGGWYPYVNIGDTIVGNARFMNEPVNKSWYYASLRSPTPVTAIRYVNGRELTAARDMARRDSIMREINNRQK